MTTLARPPRAASGVSSRAGPFVPRLPFAERTRNRIGYLLLAAIAYVPVLLTKPGKVAADTKTYLYLDPGRLLRQASSMWDSGIGMGTVTHQTIGYLFPMGPFYWLLERGLHLPEWTAQRIWLGTLLLAAGLGMRFLLRTIGMRGPGVVVGALAFMFTPYVLDYSARISVILGPWAALPWMVALVVLASRHGGWRYPALFAVTVQLVGGVNATALLFAGLAPVLWIPYSVWVTHETTWRRARLVLWRTGFLTLVTSLWWIAGLWAQGSYGLDILRFTETVQTVSRTSFPNEILRGLGYWFFYGQDKIGPWTESALDYTQRIWLILVSYAIPSLALLSAGVVRWRYRAYFALITLLGVALAVGASPYLHPSALGALFKAFSANSTAGLAMRSTGRAVPLVVLGLAALLAAGVNAVNDALVARGLSGYGLVGAGLVVVLLLVNFPALWDGTYYGNNLVRPENVPGYWKRALRYLDAQPHDTRVLALPGADFASYRWGNTVDPIEPGLMRRPFVARELIPWGSAPSQNLLDALDRRFQERVGDPAALAPIARLMGVGDVLLRMDLQTDRYNLIRSQFLWPQFAPTPPPGLGDPRTFGTRIPGRPTFPQVDEQALAFPPGAEPPPPLAVLPVEQALPIVRTTSADRPLVVDGDGEGLVDVATIGLLADGRAVLYSGSYADDPGALRRRVGPDATLVVTDSNRRRAQRWSTVRDDYGYTEQAGEKPLVADPSDARLAVFPGAPDDAYTVTEQRGVKTVQASHYGNPISYTAEDRAERALDGDINTAWKVGAFSEVRGERIRLVLDHPITTDHVNLLQPLNGPRDRWITKITMRFDGGHPQTAALGDASRDPSGKGQDLRFPRRTFRTFDITIDDSNVPRRPDYSGASAVGFSEIRLRDDKPGARDVRVDEVIRMPRDLLGALGASSLEHPLVLFMTRDRQYPVPPRYDPELNLARAFSLPTARSFALSGTVRLDQTAPDDELDALLGIPGPAGGGIDVTTSSHLPGDIAGRGSSALDGNPGTAWSTPFVGPVGQWIRVKVPHPVTFDHLDLRLVDDGRHSVPTRLAITSDDGTTRTVDVPPVADQQAQNATVSVPVHFAPISGRVFTFAIEAVREVKTLEYFGVTRIVMPAAIAELGIPGVQRAPVPAQVPSTCHDGLVTIDGKPVPVRILGSTAAAGSYGALSLEPCDPSATVSLGPGEHVLRTVSGRVSGVDFDRVVLSSAAGGRAAPVAALAPGGAPAPAPGTARPTAPAAPAMRILKQGRTSMTVRVARATQPFWLVLGESHNDGWSAKANGHGLGKPQLIDGYANGWLVRPTRAGEHLTLSLEWLPQRTVRVALLLTVVGALLCLGIVVVSSVRRRRAPGAPGSSGPRGAAPGAAPVLADPLVADGRPPGPLAVTVTTLLAGAGAAVLVRPWCGPVVGAAVLLVLVRPRGRAVLSLFPAFALGLCGLYVAVTQFRHRIPSHFEWPTAFWRVRTLGWLAVVALAADVLVGLVRGTDRVAGTPSSVPPGAGSSSAAASES